MGKGDLTFSTLAPFNQNQFKNPWPSLFIPYHDSLIYSPPLRSQNSRSENRMGENGKSPFLVARMIVGKEEGEGIFLQIGAH